MNRIQPLDSGSYTRILTEFLTIKHDLDQKLKKHQIYSMKRNLVKVSLLSKVVDDMAMFMVWKLMDGDYIAVV